MNLFLRLFNVLRGVGWKEYTLAGLAAAAVALALLFYQEHGRTVRSAQSTEQIRLAYENQKKELEVERTKIVEPTTITRRTFKMSWEEFAANNPDQAARAKDCAGSMVDVEEVKEVHGGSSETEKRHEASAPDSGPLLAAAALAQPRTNRWLVGAIVDHGSFREVGQYSLMGGYSLWDRVDLLAGGGANGLKAGVILRF